MNGEIEKGLKAWLEERGIAVPVFTGLSDLEHPPDQQSITCYVSDVERAAGPLYRANSKIIIATPPHSNESNDSSTALTAHRELSGVVRGLLEDHDISGLKASFNAATTLFSKGAFLMGEESASEEGMWVTTFNFRMGVATSES